MQPPPPPGEPSRSLWSLDPAMTFLNHGSYGGVPVAVQEARTRWLRRIDAQPLQWLEWARLGGIRQAAERVAPALGARGEDLAFVDNATTGVNAVLRSLSLRPGDVLLTTTHTYDAVALSLRYVADRAGATVVRADVPFPLESPEQVTRAVQAVLTGRERIAVLDWISSATGVVFPAVELAGLCRDAGVPVLIDGAHVPGQLPLDLEDLGADWFVGNLHKWLYAPRGCAVLHARPERQEGLAPTVISHGFPEGFGPAFDWLGTRDPTPWLVAPDAVDFGNWLGLDETMANNRSLRADAVALLTERWGTRAPVPAALTANMATLEPPLHIAPTLAASQAVHDALWERHRIEVPVFPFGDRSWLRISAQRYNTLHDYERLANVLTADGVA